MTIERPSPDRTLASRFRRTASDVSSRPDIPASAPWLLFPTAISTAVAAFRICVSAGALLVFTRGLGPASPPLIAYVLVTYALYGVATLLMALQARPSVTAYPVDQLAADVLAYAAILYATGGIYSQFWPLCTVPVICSAMRTRPLDVTAVAVLMGSFVVATTFVHAPNILLYPIPAEVIRLRGVIQVGTIFLAIAFSAHSAQVFNRFRLLTLIPSGQEETAVEFGRACAGRYQSILSPTLTVIEFTAGGGPYRFVALADGTRIMETRPDASAAASVVEAPARLALRRLGDVLDTPGEAIRQGLESQKLSPDTVGAAILAPFHTRHGSGHVAVFDVNRRDLGDELVVNSMARQIAGDLEAIRLSEHRKTLALHEQKIRFARDLHDGILQTMAGLGMQMQALIKASPDAGDQTAVQLSELRGVLVAEQRQLRELISHLQSGEVDHFSRNPLPNALSDLIHRLEVQWGASISLRNGLASDTIDEVHRFVEPLIREAVANGARHGGATGFQIFLERVEDKLLLQVFDNGRGLRRAGHVSPADPDGLTIASASIHGRVSELGGEWWGFSSPSGYQLSITLPSRSSRSNTGTDGAPA